MWLRNMFSVSYLFYYNMLGKDSYYDMTIFENITYMLFK